MREVAHLVAFPDADHVPEIVLDDPEVVAVVVDVGGKEQCVAATHYSLLAQIGRAPIDFQPELVGFDDFRRLPKSFSKLCEERYIPVRRSLVIDETCICELTRS